MVLISLGFFFFSDLYFAECFSKSPLRTISSLLSLIKWFLFFTPCLKISLILSHFSLSPSLICPCLPSFYIVYLTWFHWKSISLPSSLSLSHTFLSFLVYLALSFFFFIWEPPSSFYFKSLPMIQRVLHILFMQHIFISVAWIEMLSCSCNIFFFLKKSKEKGVAWKWNIPFGFPQYIYNRLYLMRFFIVCPQWG